MGPTCIKGLENIHQWFNCQGPFVNIVEVNLTDDNKRYVLKDFYLKFWRCSDATFKIVKSQVLQVFDLHVKICKIAPESEVEMKA